MSEVHLLALVGFGIVLGPGVLQAVRLLCKGGLEILIRGYWHSCIHAKA